MPNLAYYLLILWFPVVFFIFERFPIHKAIIVSFVSAWLFLPTTMIPMSGIPDWGKMSATVASVMACTCMKRFSTYLRIKPSWLDLPVAVFCFCPFVSAISANEGAYDGSSAVLDELFRWGFPYLIGRAFLGDIAGNKLLCYSIAVGGILYIPICLFEMRMGPILKMTIYGVSVNGTVFDLRYGGYRPMGFLETGLELGWWMCCATFCAFLLWKSGSVRQIQGYPMGPITLVLGLVTVSCKSTGAILQLIMGFTMIHLARATRNSIVFWPVLLIPPTYCIARPTGLMTGERLVAYASHYLGPDRAQSLGFRFDQEEKLMLSALQRPIFGWARNGGFNPPDQFGQTLITDGLWIIVLGTTGSVGLIALMFMLLLPTIVFIRRFKTDLWFQPDIAPVTTLVVLLPLFLIDNLSNAMLNPIYAIAMGSVTGFLTRYSARDLASGRGLGRAQASITGESHDAGQAAAAEPALVAFEARRYEEAIRSLDDELDDLHRAFRHRPTPEHLVALGRAHGLRARCYQRMHEPARSIEEREYLLALWSQYASLLDGDPVDHPEFAANLNDLAWSLLSSRPGDRDAVDRAADLAARVVEAHPSVGVFWNTLGVARYRAGDYLAAIQALSRSINLSPGHGSPYDFYYLALANHRLGYRKPAEAWLGRGEAMHPEDDQDDPVIEILRDEALAEFDS